MFPFNYFLQCLVCTTRKIVVAIYVNMYTGRMSQQSTPPLKESHSPSIACHENMLLIQEGQWQLYWGLGGTAWSPPPPQTFSAPPPGICL